MLPSRECSTPTLFVSVVGRSTQQLTPKNMTMNSLLALWIIFAACVMLERLAARPFLELDRGSLEKMKALRKSKLADETYYVYVVEDKSKLTTTSISKLTDEFAIKSEFFCAFETVADVEIDRFPRNINIAELVATSEPCVAIEQEFTVLKKKDGLVYTVVKQMKPVAFKRVPRKDR